MKIKVVFVFLVSCFAQSTLTSLQTTCTKRSEALLSRRDKALVGLASNCEFECDRPPMDCDFTPPDPTRPVPDPIPVN